MFQKRLAVIWLVITLGMFVILCKLFYLQVIRADAYRKRAESNITYRDDIETSRGRILDRNGEVLAQDETEYDVRVYLERLDHTTDRLAWCREFAKLVGMDASALAANVEASEQRVVELAMRAPEARRAKDLLYLRKRVPQPVLTRLDADARRRIDLGADALPQCLDHGKPIPVFEVHDSARRQYKCGSLAPHIVGYMGRVNDREWNELGYRFSFAGEEAKKFQPSDLIGRTGVEASYEADLRGARGMIFGFKDARLRPIAGLPSTRIEPVPGQDVTLTLDARLQRIAEESLDRQLAALERNRHAGDPHLAGAVVVFDPRTGDVLAAASAPRYDLNMVYYKYEDLANDPRRPFFHRATLGAYPLGSVFKIVVATAGLEEGVLTGHTEFTCSRTFDEGGRVRSCTAAHGTVEMSRAIEQSCNVYFWNAGLVVGGARMQSWANAFGLGRKTGVDVAEAAGRIPSPGGRADTLNMAIGQGETLVTPLQAARFMGALALDGVLAEPRFATTKPQRFERVELHPDRLGVIRWGMHDVVEGSRGTARANGRVEGLDYAAKTGTAQTAHVDLYDAWFAGFAPFRDPRVSFACVIENTRGHGGTDATPVVKEIFERMMGDPKLAGWIGGRGGEK